MARRRHRSKRSSLNCAWRRGVSHTLGMCFLSLYGGISEMRDAIPLPKLARKQTRSRDMDACRSWSSFAMVFTPFYQPSMAEGAGGAISSRQSAFLLSHSGTNWDPFIPFLSRALIRLLHSSPHKEDTLRTDNRKYFVTRRIVNSRQFTPPRCDDGHSFGGLLKKQCL